MAEAKTKETNASVEDFLSEISDETKRDDCFALTSRIKALTKMEPKMWGPSIVGFGRCHYKYESGREGDMPLAAFSPRKQSITIYVTGNVDRYEELKQLGKFKASGCCLYIKTLDDVDINVLDKVMKKSFQYAQKLYPPEKKKA